MESNTKGLVAAGHEMASELKAECGAVDMRSVAKLLSDLATQLEVQLARAKSGLAWIYNTLFGPGELPDESEKDAQAYFNRKYAPIDEKLMALHKWFWEQSEAERAAGIRIKGE